MHHTSGKSSNKPNQIVATVFCDRTRDHNVNSDYETLNINYAGSAIQKNRRGMLTYGVNVVILIDNAVSHTARAMLKHFNWELFDHFPYFLDLAPSDLPQELGAITAPQRQR
jgi:hypothetical protein